MSMIWERLKDYWSRKDREVQQVNDEVYALEDELKALRNEARYMEEPSFLSDLERRRDLLEVQTRALIYEMKEPQRSQLQGRCQTLLEEIGRPEFVQARIGDINNRLAELRELTLGPDDRDMVERASAA